MGEGIVTAEGGIPVVTGKPRIGDRVLYQFLHPRTCEPQERPAIVVALREGGGNVVGLQVFLDGGNDSDAFGLDAASRGLAYRGKVPEGDAPGTWRFFRE